MRSPKVRATVLPVLLLIFLIPLILPLSCAAGPGARHAVLVLDQYSQRLMDLTGDSRRTLKSGAERRGYRLDFIEIQMPDGARSPDADQFAILADDGADLFILPPSYTPFIEKVIGMLPEDSHVILLSETDLNNSAISDRVSLVYLRPDPADADFAAFASKLIGKTALYLDSDYLNPPVLAEEGESSGEAASETASLWMTSLPSDTVVMDMATGQPADPLVEDFRRRRSEDFRNFIFLLSPGDLSSLIPEFERSQDAEIAACGIVPGGRVLGSFTYRFGEIISNLPEDDSAVYPREIVVQVPFLRLLDN